MRCPHCRGEIPGGSRFCGVCGADVSAPPTTGGARSRASAQADAASASLFELPVSRGARLARVFVVLALDVLLAGAGVAMILAYVDSLDEASAGELGGAADAGVAVEVEALPPQPVAVGDEPLPAAGEGEEGDGDEGAGGDEPEPRRERERERDEAKREPAREREEAREPEREREPEPERGDPEPERDPEPEPADAEDGPTLEDPYPDPGSPSEPSADAGAMPDDVERLAARISLLVDRHQAQLQRCYERAAKLTTPSDPLEGRVEVRFEVTPEGRAQNVRVHANDTGSRGLGECLTGLVESWSFPAGAREPTEFLWPFVFRAPQ